MPRQKRILFVLCVEFYLLHLREEFIACVRVIANKIYIYG